MSIFDVVFRSAQRKAATQARIYDQQRTIVGLQAEVYALRAELDRKSQMPGGYRYWEGRYRDADKEITFWKSQYDRLLKRAADLAGWQAPPPIILAKCPSCGANMPTIVSEKVPQWPTKF